MISPLMNPEAIFWPKRDVNGKRRIHKEKLNNLYCLSKIVRVIKYRILKWEDNLARMEEGNNPFKILIRKPTGKRPLGRPKHKWDYNIRMNLKELGVNTRNWLALAQYMDNCRAIVNAKLYLRIPKAMESVTWLYPCYDWHSRNVLNIAKYFNHFYLNLGILRISFLGSSLSFL